MRTLLIFSAIVLLSACNSSDAGNEVQEAQQYELLTIQQSDFEYNTVYSATVRGLNDIAILPKIEGYLDGVFVKEGDRVKAGQLLFSIDSGVWSAAADEAAANVEQMSAALEKAQLEYDGKLKLNEKQIVSDYELATAKSDLSIAKANLSAAKAALNTARNNLSFTQLRSPSDGVTGKIPYRKGDFVSPNIEYGLTKVSENRKMRVYFSLPESEIIKYITEYKSFNAAVESFPELSLQFADGTFYGIKGKAESISGIIDDKTGSVSVCAIFNNPNGVLLSGMTAKVVITNSMKSAIVIPQESAYQILDKVYVMKVIDGKATASIIKTAPQNNGTQYIVEEGLTTGDVIIAKGASFVEEGTEVEPKNQEE